MLRLGRVAKRLNVPGTKCKPLPDPIDDAHFCRSLHAEAISVLGRPRVRCYFVSMSNTVTCELAVLLGCDLSDV